MEMMKTFGSFSWFLAVTIIVVGFFSGCENRVDLGPIADAASAKSIRAAFTSKAPAAERKAVTGTGWATIKGQFVFDGDPPAMPPYAVNKEPDICTDHGKAPLQETLLVDPGTKGIKNVVVFLRDASRVNDSAKAKSDTVVFDQKECLFLTHVAALTVGQSLDIKNSDPTGHNTNIPGMSFNQLIATGGSVPIKIQKESTVPMPVNCSIHPWMRAYLLTRKDGYFAVTDEKGNFQIANVPAGEPLEFQVWHESGGAAGQGLVGTSPGAADVKWTNRGRMEVKLNPDEQKEVKVVVPAKAFHL
jgi:hypothetical protein